MKIDWTVLLTSLGISGILISSLAWLLKTIIAHQLVKDVESFKRQLQFEQIRFSRLHERRAEIIHELYKKIVHIRRLCHSLKTENQDLKDIENSRAANEVFEALIRMNFYFGENALYFPQRLRDKYSEVFTKGILKPVMAIGMMDEIDTFQKLKPEHRVTLRNGMLPLLKKELVEFDVFISELELEFQTLLGVTDIN
jgi:hypothetical protein